MIRTSMLFSCLLLCCATRTATAQQLTDSRIASEAAQLAEWKLFWEGQESIPTYRAGTTVDLTVVSLGDDTAVFIQDLRTAIYLTSENGSIVKRVIGGMPMGTTAASVEKYLADKSGVPGFVLKPGAPAQPPGVPIRREGSNFARAQTRIVHLRLPALSPPDYILSGKRPGTLAELVAAARERVSAYHASACGEASVTIPLYSEQDPVVYVLVDFGKGCEAGIFPFQRDGAKWAAGQFLPNRPPADWSYTVTQIRKHALSQFSIP